MIYFFVSELFSRIAGFYISIFFITVKIIDTIVNPQRLRENIILIALMITLVVYYFIVKIIRRNKLEKTEASEKFFKNLANIALQPMILKDKKGEILFTSDSISKLLNVKKTVLIGRSLIPYIHADDVAIYREFYKEIIRNPNTKVSAEFRLKKNNEWIWIKNEAINLLKQKGVNSIVASIQDISFQKNIDKEKSKILEDEKNARELAEKAVKDRDEFMSIASHELKTPLTTILLQLQSTLRKISSQTLADFSGGDLLNSLQIAEKQSKNLAVLIKDLLNVSLASTGRISLTKEKVDLSKIVESLLEKYSEEIKISGSAIDIDTESDIFGNWDPVRIEQAMTNLLTNALKYGKGNKISISTNKNKGWAIFKIKDRGHGIRPGLSEDIFKPFERANSIGNIKGLGVGLFIARQIVRAHNGDITVESEESKGSTFTLKLPITP
jgi:PAS domain S-box-containing protein